MDKKSLPKQESSAHPPGKTDHSHIKNYLKQTDSDCSAKSISSPKAGPLPQQDAMLNSGKFNEYSDSSPTLETIEYEVVVYQDNVIANIETGNSEQSVDSNVLKRARCIDEQTYESSLSVQQSHSKEFQLLTDESPDPQCKIEAESDTIMQRRGQFSKAEILSMPHQLILNYEGGQPTTPQMTDTPGPNKSLDHVPAVGLSGSQVNGNPEVQVENKQKCRLKSSEPRLLKKPRTPGMKKHGTIPYHSPIFLPTELGGVSCIKDDNLASSTCFFDPQLFQKSNSETCLSTSASVGYQTQQKSETFQQPFSQLFNSELAKKFHTRALERFKATSSQISPAESKPTNAVTLKLKPMKAAINFTQEEEPVLPQPTNGISNKSEILPKSVCTDSARKPEMAMQSAELPKVLSPKFELRNKFEALPEAQAMTTHIPNLFKQVEELPRISETSAKPLALSKMPEALNEELSMDFVTQQSTKISDSELFKIPPIPIKKKPKFAGGFVPQSSLQPELLAQSFNLPSPSSCRKSYLQALLRSKIASNRAARRAQAKRELVLPENLAPNNKRFSKFLLPTLEKRLSVHADVSGAPLQKPDQTKLEPSITEILQKSQASTSSITSPRPRFKHKRKTKHTGQLHRLHRSKKKSKTASAEIKSEASMMAQLGLTKPLEFEHRCDSEVKTATVVNVKQNMKPDTVTTKSTTLVPTSSQSKSKEPKFPTPLSKISTPRSLNKTKQEAAQPKMDAAEKMLRFEVAKQLEAQCKYRHQPEMQIQSAVAADLKECMKQGALFKPKNNSTIHKENKKFETVELTSMDPLMLYGINLHRYANNMNEMIRVVELALESNLIPPADAAPVMPQKPEVQIKHIRNSINFMPKEITSFSLGIGDTPTEVSTMVVRDVLQQSVAVIVGLLGFETTHESVLQVLVDVLIAFLKKIAYRLKLANEDEQRGWLTGFPNIAERVLVELGMGGCRGLHDYYEVRVNNYVELLERHCQDLNKHYKRLIVSKTHPSGDLIPNELFIKVETEEEVMELDASQVQIALNEEIELPSLDAGFQLLSSLEANT